MKSVSVHHNLKLNYGGNIYYHIIVIARSALLVRPQAGFKVPLHWSIMQQINVPHLVTFYWHQVNQS